MTAKEVLEAQSHVVGDLIEVYKQGGHPIPWFGAGAGRAYGFPTWGSFLTNSPVSAEKRAKIQLLLNRSKYEKAADYVHKCLGSEAFENYFSTTFAIDPVSPVSSSLVSEGLRLSYNFVITTNYDQTLLKEVESRFGYVPRPFDVVHPEIIPASQGNGFAIWRMHGACDNYMERVLLSSEYNEKYGKKSLLGKLNKKSHSKLEKVLNALFPKQFVFLGCSLTADRTMDAMYKWAKTVPATSASFAFLEEFDTDKTEVRAKFLSDRNIRPIFFPQGAYHHLPEMISIIADEVEHLFERPYLTKAVGLSIQSRLSPGEAPRLATDHKPHLDLCSHFEGQKLKAGLTWNELANEIDQFLKANARAGSVNIDLSTHLSLAYFVGTRFPDTSTSTPILLQRLGKRTETWSPLDGRHGPEWDIDRIEVGKGNELGIVVDTKIGASGEAVAYLKTIPSIGKILIVSPPSGSNGHILGGSHAATIVNDLLIETKNAVPPEAFSIPKHLILAGPSGLAFALGQKSINLGPVTLYEHIRQDPIISYVPSLTCSR